MNAHLGDSDVLTVISTLLFRWKKINTPCQFSLVELAVQSPLLHSALVTLGAWGSELTADIEALHGPPPEYIPGCFAQAAAPGGQALSKYRALLEMHNTPFA